MKTAFLYAGQGSQKFGMGKEFYEQSPAFREVFDRCDLPFDLREICFGQDDGRLHRTRYTQPCLAAFAVGVTRLLAEAGIVPDYAAGLSLGEYSALYCAGVWDAQTVIGLTAFRGAAMAQASEGIDAAMTAILNLDRETLETCCGRARPLGVVEIANENCPGQLVIAGERAAVEQAAALALEAGARRAMPLAVSGPFHTSLMAPAGEALRQRLSEIPTGEMQVPVLFNCLGGLMPEGGDMRELLVRQVQTGVKMQKTIETLAALGVDTAVEIGPGRVLSGFIRRTAPSIKTYAVETPEELERAVTALKRPLL